MAEAEVPCAEASRLKSASQRSKLPVLRQFAFWLQAAVGMPASSTAAKVRASPFCRITVIRLWSLPLFPWNAAAASRLDCVVWLVGWVERSESHRDGAHRPVGWGGRWREERSGLGMGDGFRFAQPILRAILPRRSDTDRW